MQKTQWINGVLWLILLAPLFFIIYGWTNDYSAALDQSLVNEIYYAWEKNIPFLPWTIIPYWSIDLLYGLSIFLPMTVFIQRQQALRLLIATPTAAFFFYLFPLTFSFIRPVTDSLFQPLFDALMSFDKPYNQAPSLHIILLVIVWRGFVFHLKKFWLMLWHIWCILIGISVLTTFQHHFIDIPTGVLVGVLICYLFPFNRSFVLAQPTFQHSKIGWYYLIGSIFFTSIGFLVPIAVGFFLFWVALGLVFTAFGYLFFGVKVYQKKDNGKFTFASYWLFLPVRNINKLVRKYFFKTYTTPQKLHENLFLGSFESSKLNTFNHIIDLCAEYDKQNNAKNYVNFGILDLQVPSEDQVSKAILILEESIKKNEKVLVHCALGLSRSASVCMGYLLRNKVYQTVEDCLEDFKKQSILVHLSEKHILFLKKFNNESR